MSNAFISSASMYIYIYIYQHIEAETRWTPFRRRQFHVHFLQWKLLYFDYIFIEIYSQRSNWQSSSIGSDIYIYEPMMISLPTHICVTRPQWVKRKPPCIGGMELVSLSCNRVFISAESVGRGWCKIAIATKWYQFHTIDKCGFLFMPWITDQLHICAIHKTSK